MTQDQINTMRDVEAFLIEVYFDPEVPKKVRDKSNKLLYSFHVPQFIKELGRDIPDISHSE